VEGEKGCSKKKKLGTGFWKGGDGQGDKRMNRKANWSVAMKGLKHLAGAQPPHNKTNKQPTPPKENKKTQQQAGTHCEGKLEMAGLGRRIVARG